MAAFPLPLRTMRQHGLTLIELMLAITLGMGLTLAALALLNSVKSSYLAIHDQALIQDSGRYAIETIATTLRQANYVPRDEAAWSELDLSSLPAAVSGLDNRRLTAYAPALTAAQDNTANHRSDVLAVRFFGSAEHAMLNCAGFAVNAPLAGADQDGQRGWSIFYVAADSIGIPELRCKYATRDGGWNAAAIARGVEAFKVSYGMADDDGELKQWQSAQHLTQQQWSRVVAVQFALLVRGEHPIGDDVEQVYQLLDATYHSNALVTISDRKHTRKLRQVFQMTIRLRNPGT